MADIPKDFTDALKTAGLAEFFSGCTGPHQREYLEWITGAKRPETRRLRIEKAVKMIAAKSSEETVRSKKRA